ncbi:MAG: S8 family serine peptidase [Desulfobacterales bacterium]|nr:S8 family serine peptidase [Desulfobacterales bacterium]
MSVLEVDTSAKPIEQIVQELNASGAVEFAEQDHVLYMDNIPNDSQFSSLWGLNNTGQSGGVTGTDIDMLSAWDAKTGDLNMVVAVIDTGVDYNHDDLKANMWRNPGEIPGNGIDDDRNGYVDDIYGIDAANNDSDPYDDQGHGTHCAGTIGAVGNNQIGVAGVNWNVKIMALKFLRSDGLGDTSNAIKCLEYVIKMKQNYGINIKVTNNSWGSGPPFSYALYDAIKKARDAGILFIAAAGNDAMDNDINPHYPSSYDLDNIISVASIDRYNSLSFFSCFGKWSVDLGAPGSSILSTIPGNQYQFYSGTSMATPHVSGAAALIWSQYPSYSWQEIKNLILNNMDYNGNLANKTVTNGVLNVAKAIYAHTPSPTNNVYIDASWSGYEKGTITNPFKKIANGLAILPSNGILWLKRGSYTGSGNEPMTFNKPMTIRSYEGTASIGKYISSMANNRYSDNGDGTITDTQTNLMWQKSDDNTVRTWEDGKEYVENLTLASYTDWKLPTKDELLSLVDPNYGEPTIDSLFTCSPSSYWTSDSFWALNPFPVSVSFKNGEIKSGNGNFYVRAVRGNLLQEAVAVNAIEPPSKVIWINPTTVEDKNYYKNNRINLSLKNNVLQLSYNFPSYTSAVDIYAAVALPDKNLYFIGSNGDLIEGSFSLISTGTEAVIKPYVWSLDILNIPQYGEWTIYWLVTPSNGGDFSAIDLSNDPYEVGWYSVWIE